MKKIECWHWQLRSDAAPHDITTTRWLITEAEARQRDPNAVRVPGTLVVRELPETYEEKSARRRLYDVNPTRARVAA
jgi:hypothetical protein